MKKSALILSMLLAACVPARLQRVPVREHHSISNSGNLERAFGGASDDATKLSLGNWIEKNHHLTNPEQPNGIRASFHPGGPGVFSPHYFDRLEAVGNLKVDGLPHHRMEGVGVPMVGYRENRGREAVEKWYPPEGITRAVTAVAIPGPAGKVEIRLIDRMHAETVTIGGKHHPLAADFTVPFVTLLEKTGSLLVAGFTSTVRLKSVREPGFALMEPYDPDRTPLILIHGLFSTPLAWAKLTNELWAVPEVRRRYQIWHYLYPTNPPALYSARVMRGKLDELRVFLDPEGGDPAMRCDRAVQRNDS